MVKVISTRNSGPRGEMEILSERELSIDDAIIDMVKLEFGFGGRLKDIDFHNRIIIIQTIIFGSVVDEVSYQLNFGSVVDEVSYQLNMEEEFYQMIDIVKRYEDKMRNINIEAIADRLHKITGGNALLTVTAAPILLGEEAIRAVMDEEKRQYKDSGMSVYRVLNVLGKEVDQFSAESDGQAKAIQRGLGHVHGGVKLQKLVVGDEKYDWTDVDS